MDQQCWLEEMEGSWWIDRQREGKGNNALVSPDAFHYIEKNIWDGISDKNMEKEVNGKTGVTC